METIKILFGTLLLTLLIWTTADQLLSDTDTVDVTLIPVTSGDKPARIVTEPPGMTRFKLTVSGPKRYVDTMRNRARSGQLKPISIDVPDDLSGSITFDVRQALERQPEHLPGLRIDRVEPSQVQVLIDRLTTVNMPIHIPKGLREYDVPPSADPASVMVTIPERVLAALPQQHLVLPVTDLFRGRPAGEPLNIPGVPLPSNIDGVEIKTDPSNVTIRATLRKQLKTGTIPAVPIAVQASPENFNRFEIRTRDGRTLISRAIAVQGPPAIIDGLVAGRVQVLGRIILTGDDLQVPEGQYVEIQPKFDLPPEVHLTSPVQPVELRLVPRAVPSNP